MFDATLFATLDGKCFLFLSDIAPDIPVLTDMHVPTLARMLTVLQLLVLDLCELLQILCLFYSLCISMQPHTTSQIEYRLHLTIVHRLNAITVSSHKIPESQNKTPFICEKHSTVKSHKLDIPIEIFVDLNTPRRLV